MSALEKSGKMHAFAVMLRLGVALLLALARLAAPAPLRTTGVANDALLNDICSLWVAIESPNAAQKI